MHLFSEFFVCTPSKFFLFLAPALIIRTAGRYHLLVNKTFHEAKNPLYTSLNSHLGFANRIKTKFSAKSSEKYFRYITFYRLKI